MKVLVVGAGGVGGYYGGVLARNGEEVTLIARGDHLRAILRDGLRVRSEVAGCFTVRPMATDRPDGSGRPTSPSSASRATTMNRPSR